MLFRSEYLLYALSHKLVVEQAKNKIFIDTTLPNIAERWTEIKIPIFNDDIKFNILKSLSASIIKGQWEALKEIDNLKKNYDVYNT